VNGLAPLVLPISSLQEAGLLTIKSDGTFEVDQGFVEFVQEMLNTGDTATLSATMNVMDDSGAANDSVQASVNLTIEGEGGEVPQSQPFETPDFLVPLFDESGDPAGGSTDPV